MPYEMERDRYARLYGPTTGDRVRLGDTELFAEVEADFTRYGDEPLAGFGKTIRDRLLATSRAGRDSELDLVIVGAVIIDPVLGVVKGSIGIKDGRIVGVGRAGSPELGGSPDLVIGSNTGVLPAEGLIATPGGVDTHVHFSSAAIVPAALSSGLTTLVGMGYGGVWDLGVNPAYNLRRMQEAWEGIPLNVAFLGRGSSLERGALARNLEAGCAGLKVHEDTGAYPEIVAAALTVAEEYDVQVALHTDGLNESGELEETLDAIGGRTIHAYHIEGAGGGHPNVLELVSQPHVLSSSTTPTIPFTVHTAGEHFDMTMTVHRLSRDLPADVAAVRARIRPSTMAAETLLHDLGAIPIIASDSNGMGRIGEVIARTWQLAHVGKLRSQGEPAAPPASAPGTARPADNDRILRYLAKYTLNPAIAHGLAHEVGSLEPGKLADVVLWHPAYFGAKPNLVVKAGFVAWGVAGDGNGTTRLCQPLRYRPYYGGLGAAAASLGVTFVSRAAYESGPRVGRWGRRFSPVGHCRRLTKADLRYNAACPSVRVDPATLAVTVDDAPVRVEPARSLPLTRRYWLL